ncbi:MAG TPA: DMT family transporter [Herpetosiphonaceae bacterium]|nr:DMT family transporter [Herpetosiphonaceae bacterium]
MLESKSALGRRGVVGLFSWLMRRPYALLALAPLFWSANAVVGRAVAGQVPPVGLAFWRWLVAAAIMAAVAWRHVRRDWPVIVRERRILFALSLLGIATFNTLVYMGLRVTTAINGVLMQTTMPVWIVCLSWLFFRERIAPRQVPGLIISFVGSLVIVARGSWAALLGLSLNQGDVLVLVAVIAYAAYSTLLRRRPPIHPLSFLAVTFAGGTLLLLPAYLWEHLRVQAMPLNGTTLLAVAYIALFPSILAYLCYNRGVELVGANVAGLFIHLMPVFGSIMAMIFLNERLHWFHAAGLLLILIGIVLTARGRRPQPG